jgi:hypothetical protein
MNWTIKMEASVDLIFRWNGHAPIGCIYIINSSLRPWKSVCDIEITFWKSSIICFEPGDINLRVYGVLQGVIVGEGEIWYDTELVVLINEATRGSVIVETRCKMYGVKTGGVPAGSNFFHDVGANRIRIITGRQVIWRHVARSEVFIVAETETITVIC